MPTSCTLRLPKFYPSLSRAETNARHTAVNRQTRRTARDEIAGQLDADEDFVSPGEALVADMAWEAEDDAYWATVPDFEPTGCYCRRCFLHDDPGGCLVIEAEMAER